MIAHLRGKLVEKNPAYCIIECGGVGYHVNISLQTFGRIPDNEQVFLYTHLIVREDAQILYGFWDKPERVTFLLLISVSGIGPNTARMILSSLTTDELKSAIATDNVAVLKSVKGIGAKSAQRVIVDLRDKIGEISGETEISVSSSNTNKNEALLALEVLGFNRQKAGKVIDKLQSVNREMTVEVLVKEALKNL
jgi:Holliday junction DNA helicase RuvA